MRAYHIQRLEQKLLLAADAWRDIPVSIDQPATQANLNLAAYDLIGSAQQRSTYGLTGAGYSVAVIDTGLDYHNPAFAGRYLGGWNFVSSTDDPMDDNGHGTHVTGIIASADKTYPGVAPGVGIIALKTLDSTGAGTYGLVDEALQWVATHQAQYHIAAVNMSLGDGNYTTNPYTFLDADLEKLENQGIFISVASGNSHFDKPGLAFPAVDPLVVSVGAVWAGDFGGVSWVNGDTDNSTTADQITSFTQRDDKLNLLAPGAFVTSTYLANSFASIAGTSMAAPMVAGAAIMVKQKLDSLNMPSAQSDVLHTLLNTGVSVADVQQGQDNVEHTGLTFQRIDLLSAIASLTPSNTTFVTSTYEHVLGRDTDPDGLRYWVSRLDAGLTRAQFATIIWASAEHHASQIVDVYHTVLHRAPGPDEVAYWQRQMADGLTIEAITVAFTHSAEFLGGSEDAFLDNVYSGLLGREVDPASRTIWEGYLSKGLTRAAIVDAVLASEEHAEYAVDLLYESILDRQGDKSGLQYWASRSVDLAAIASLLLASDEFYERSV